MPSPGNDADDRRRSARFTCGGEVRIQRLPADEIVVAGKLRNLSRGGLCVDAACAMELGARTEIVVSVNASRFRALGLVRGVEHGSRARMEFVHMTANSRGMLEDLLVKLARLQGVMRKLRSEHVEPEEDLSRELAAAGLRTTFLGEQFWRQGQAVNVEEKNQACTAEKRIVETLPLLIKVDLFG